MELIRRILAELSTSNAATADADVSMMEFGLDSLSATEVPPRISALTGIHLSSTLVFEHPTPRAVADHVLELSSRLRTVAGVGLSPTLVFEHPSPRAIAAHILEETCQG